MAKTFAEGSASCGSGYYHGVLERALIGVRGYRPEKLAGVARGLCDDAGVREVPLHDARHTAATLLLLQGVDIRTVMAIMGWTEMATAQRYVHAVDELRHEAARRMGAALWGGATVDPSGGHQLPG